MKGIYLACYKAYHNNYNLDYNDIKKTSEHVNIIDDMLKVNLDKYDYIIATPPCNYWSRANYRRENSKYSQDTKHLLPEILNKLTKQNKPFIVENVKNYNLFNKYQLYNLPCYIYEIGRHTYWTNIMINLQHVKQIHDDIQNTKRSVREGGKNVHNIIESWLKNIHE